MTRRPNGRDTRTLVAQLVDRDGNRCHLCRLPINVDLPGTDKLGPTLDHIQPMKAGGTHDLDNLRLAHKSCNAARGAKPPQDIGPQSRRW